MQTNQDAGTETTPTNVNTASMLASRAVLLLLVVSFALSMGGCKNPRKRESSSVRVWPPSGESSSSRFAGLEISDESSYDFVNPRLYTELPYESNKPAPVVQEGQLVVSEKSKSPNHDVIASPGSSSIDSPLSAYIANLKTTPGDQESRHIPRGGAGVANALDTETGRGASSLEPQLPDGREMADHDVSIVSDASRSLDQRPDPRGVQAAQFQATTDSGSVIGAEYQEVERSQDAAGKPTSQRFTGSSGPKQPPRFLLAPDRDVSGRTGVMPDPLQDTDVTIDLENKSLIHGVNTPSGMEAVNSNLEAIKRHLMNIGTLGIKPDPVDVGAEGIPVSTARQDDGHLSENPLDLAIHGPGFFQLTDSFGETVYTRKGHFALNVNGELVLGSNQSGRVLVPSITIPISATGLVFDPGGTVRCKQPDRQHHTAVGKIQLASFVNPEGLLSIGDDLLKETNASGRPTIGTPGDSGLGLIQQVSLAGLKSRAAASAVKDSKPQYRYQPHDPHSIKQGLWKGYVAYTDEDWQTNILRSIDQLDRDVVRETDLIAKQRLIASQRILHSLLQDRVEATRLIDVDGISPDVQKYWSAQNMALIEMLDPLGTPQGSRRARSAFGHLKEAQRQLAAASELGVRNVAFCEKVQGFGRYEEFSESKFRVDDAVVLYVELVNFAVETTADGYETEFQGGFEVYDSEGFRVAQHEFLMVKQTCRNIQTDYFLPYIMHIPKNLSPGKYRLRLTVEDRKGNKFGQSGPLEFEVAP